MIELLALKLKEVSKKASNIDEKIDNLAISQEKELNDKANAILKDFEVKYDNYVKNIALPKDGKDFDLNLWENFEKDRDIVCDNYHKLFYKKLNSSPEEYKKVKNELQRLKEIYQKYNVLNLYCWCRPKRCHAETIKEYLIKELKITNIERNERNDE